jgi:hypothetical protein
MSATLTWTSCHVSGHQEDIKAWSELTWWEQQIVRMDHAAKDKMRRPYQAAKDKMHRPYQAPALHVSENEGWSLWRGD